MATTPALAATVHESPDRLARARLVGKVVPLAALGVSPLRRNHKLDAGDVGPDLLDHGGELGENRQPAGTAALGDVGGYPNQPLTKVASLESP